MAKSISDHQRELQETLKNQLVLTIPVMARAETLSKRCNLDLCFVYASKYEMAHFIRSHDGDIKELRAKVVADFQRIYRAAISDGLEYYDLLFSACDEAGFLGSDEKARKKNVETGVPISKEWIQRRGTLLEKRAKRHTKQLADGELRLQEIAAIQNSIEEAMDRLLEAISEMYSRLANHLKTQRDKDRLKWSKIGVFVGAGGGLAKIGMGAF